MTDREKLIELVEAGNGYYYSKNYDSANVYAAIADHLLSHGVTFEKQGEWDIKHRHHGGFRKYTGVDEFGETRTITVDERFESDEPYCPYCGKWNESVWKSYCPNCGARMKGENNGKSVL